MTTSPASFANHELHQRVAANLTEVRRRIVATGRSLSSVRLVGVTKSFTPDVVRVAVALGLSTLGENYVDELRTKHDATRDVGVEWHYLGALQSNKIARVLEIADVICGVSRVKEIEKIASLRPATPIYVQVDFTRDGVRNGAAPSHVALVVARALTLGLEVRGLMTVAPTGVREAREAFRATSDLADELGLVERSMGMSDDLELACECGTSEVRVGRALFGPRDPERGPWPNMGAGGTASRRTE